MTAHLVSNEGGGTGVLVALMMPILLSLVAFAVDIAFWYKTENDLQGIADVAALSAIIAREEGAGFTDSKLQAEAVVGANGYINGQEDVTVTVRNPPQFGKYTGDVEAFEVAIEAPAASLFGKLLGSAPLLGARAVATREPKEAPACVLALDSTASKALNLTGGSTLIEAVNCGVAVNSSSSSAANMSGGAAIITDQTFSVLGNYAVSGSSYLKAKEVKKGITSPDPYATLDVPPYSGCDFGSYTLSGGSASIEPGVYCGSITVSGGGTLTMNPGLYIIRGSLTVSSSSLYANDVSMVLTKDTSGKYGQFTLSGGAVVEMSPIQAGPLTGVSVYMDRNAPSGTKNHISGGSNASIMGSLYFPSAIVTYSGGSTSGNSCLQLVARIVTISGGANFGTDCGSLNVPGLDTPTMRKTLVE